MLDQARDMQIDQPVVMAVEIIHANKISDAVPCLVFKQQASQNGLLGFYRMRG